MFIAGLIINSDKFAQGFVLENLQEQKWYNGSGKPVSLIGCPPSFQPKPLMLKLVSLPFNFLPYTTEKSLTASLLPLLVVLAIMFSTPETIFSPSWTSLGPIASSHRARAPGLLILVAFPEPTPLCPCSSHILGIKTEWNIQIWSNECDVEEYNPFFGCSYSWSPAYF